MIAPWSVCHIRTRRLVAVDAEGRLEFVDDGSRALRFRSADEARAWLREHSSVFGELGLIRERADAGAKASAPDDEHDRLKALRREEELRVYAARRGRV